MDKAAVETAKAFRRHIGRIIRKNRKRSGLKQYNLAKMLGVEEATVSRYENAKAEIRASTMAYISHICDFDLIEYIPFDDTSAAQKFKEMTHMSNITPFQDDAVPVQKFRAGSLKDIRFMEFMPDGKALFSATAGEGTGERKPKTDILTDLPKTMPSPLCDDDDRAFDIHIAKEDNRNRLRILLYGYRLMMLFQEMDTPWQTTSSMARQILRRLIKTASGEIDQAVYGYYWKCVYYHK